MNFIELVTRLDGRINRAKYWLGSIVTGLIFVAITIPLIFAQGLPEDPEDLKSSLWWLPILQLIFLYPWTAIMVKRLHDRNRPSYFAAFMVVPILISMATNFLGLTGDAEHSGALDWILGVIILGVGIWFFIELGCLRGTIGDNQYGPDPLAAQVTAPSR